MTEIQSTTSATEADTATTEELWAAQARNALIETAGSYNSVITYKELSELVQERSGVTTSQLMHHWIGGVLGHVTQECAERDEPNLSSLCVDSTGSVGAGYVTAVGKVHGKLEGNADDHAAAERLRCYGHFGATLPAGGGFPELTPQVQRKRDRESAVRMAAIREPGICPTCNTAVPASGVCDYCD